MQPNQISIQFTLYYFIALKIQSQPCVCKPANRTCTQFQPPISLHCSSFSLSRAEVTAKVEGVPIKDTMLSEICPDIEAAFCFPQKYRTPNGECNNVKNPMWGVTGAAYLRIMAPQYEDGVGIPRTTGALGGELLDALSISSQLLWSHDDPHEHMTSLAAIWGQFVAHDISYTLPLSGYEQVRSHFLSKSAA